MEPEILKVTPFSGEGNAVAAIKLGYGPISIHTKLVRGDNDRFFLGMPSRFSESENTWFRQAEIEDRRVYQLAVQKARDAYESVMARKQVAATV